MRAIFFIIIPFFFLFTSCKKKNTEFVPEIKVVIYKFKGNYINKVCVGMSDDKSKIQAFPGPTDPAGDTIPSYGYTALKNGYYQESGKYSYGIGSAYLDINRADFRSFCNIGPYNSDTIKRHILDIDPYLEYYTCGIDTFAKDTNLMKHLDEYIANNELVSKLKFKKLK